MDIFLQRTMAANLIILFVLVSRISVGLGQQLAVARPGDAIYTECGGIVPLTYYHVNTISYKNGTEYDDYEFCTWTIQPRNPYDCLLFELNYPANFSVYEPSDGFLVHAWDYGGSLHTTQLYYGYGQYVCGRLFFLTLSTYAGNHSQGSDMIIRGRLGEKNVLTFQPSSDEGTFSFPEVLGRSQYRNNRQVAILIPSQRSSPADNSTGGYHYKQIQLRDVHTEKDHDILHVYELYSYHLYRYDHYYYQGYNVVANVSGDYEGVVWNTTVNSPFPYVILFSTDDRVTGRGFTVQWKHFL